MYDVLPVILAVAAVILFFLSRFLLLWYFRLNEIADGVNAACDYLAIIQETDREIADLLRRHFGDPPPNS